VESADPGVPRAMHKGIVGPEVAMKFRDMLREEGLWSHATFSLGHPEETLDSMKLTIAYALKLNPESA